MEKKNNRYSDEVLKIVLENFNQRFDIIEDQNEKRFKNIEDENKKHCKTLYGNGQKGLGERVGNLETAKNIIAWGVTTVITMLGVFKFFIK